LTVEDNEEHGITFGRVEFTRGKDARPPVYCSIQTVLYRGHDV
jgi:hypothetical protein